LNDFIRDQFSGIAIIYHNTQRKVVFVNEIFYCLQLPLFNHASKLYFNGQSPD